ncbi:MAG TPA: argininosuccinate lyase [bacterium]
MASRTTRANKLWGGRFARATDPLVEAFTSSIAVDHKLARYDVLGSIAHAEMLGRRGIIARSDSRRLVRGLARLLAEIDGGRWTPDPSVEDVHTQVQQRLERSVGAVARKLHTARSRNDQVALDLRLYCRDAALGVQQELRAAQRALVRLGWSARDVVIPGYTHLQRAQPVLVAHHLLAYVEMLERDRERLDDAGARIAVSPLGAGALAGTSLPIDRRFVARRLGFAGVAANSMDAVADRDFAVELLAALAMLAVHLSRLAEDLILWASQEFGLLALDDAVATGSSLMPQKKNPDVLELIRGQAGLLIGNLTALLTVLKGLPLAYNRDLQFDKRLVFESVEQTRSSLAVLARVLAGARVDAARAAALVASDALCATDLAEALVERGVAFRDAHEIVGRAVAEAEALGTSLGALPRRTLARLSPHLTPGLLGRLDARRSVERKRSEGGTGRRQVAAQLARWRRRLGLGR